MDIKKYLERIHFAGPIEPTLEVLSELQRKHLLHVPFENLDIHNNIRIDLANLYEKIVTRKRGGFCYELNGLFFELLKSTGFKVKMISARVYDGKVDYSPEFDHMALIVNINSKDYLTDVGFGEFTFHPVRIVLEQEVNDPRGIFRIENYNDVYKVIKKKAGDGSYQPEYMFSEIERQLPEFYDRCNYHQTSPESHFMQKRICSLPTETGRITLTGDTIKITESGQIRELKLNTEAEIRQALRQYFGIEL